MLLRESISSLKKREKIHLPDKRGIVERAQKHCCGIVENIRKTSFEFRTKGTLKMLNHSKLEF